MKIAKKSVASAMALTLALANVAMTTLPVYADEAQTTSITAQTATKDIKYDNAQTTVFDLTTPYNGFVTTFKTNGLKDNRNLNYTLPASTETIKMRIAGGSLDIPCIKEYMDLTAKQDKQVQVLYDIRSIEVQFRTAEDNITTYSKSSDVKDGNYDKDFAENFTDMSIYSLNSSLEAFELDMADFSAGFDTNAKGDYIIEDMAVSITIAAKTLTPVNSDCTKNYFTGVKRAIANKEITIAGVSQDIDTALSEAKSEALTATKETQLYKYFEQANFETPIKFGQGLAKRYADIVKDFNSEILKGTFDATTDSEAKLKAEKYIEDNLTGSDIDPTTISVEEVKQEAGKEYTDAEWKTLTDACTAAKTVTLADVKVSWDNANSKWKFDSAATKVLTDLVASDASAETGDKVSEDNVKEILGQYISSRVFDAVGATLAAKFEANGDTSLGAVTSVAVANSGTFTNGNTEKISGVTVDSVTPKFTNDDVAAVKTYRPKALASNEQAMFLRAQGYKDVQQTTVKGQNNTSYKMYYDSTSNYITSTDNLVTKLTAILDCIEDIEENEGDQSNKEYAFQSVSTSTALIEEPEEVEARTWYYLDGAYDWRNSSYFLAEIVDTIGDAKGALVTFKVDPNSLKKNSTTIATVGNYDANKYFTTAADSVVLSVNGGSTGKFTNIVTYNNKDHTLSFRWDEVNGAKFSDSVLYVRSLGILSSLDFDITGVQVTIPDQTQFVTDTTNGTNSSDKNNSNGQEIEAGESEKNDNVLVDEPENEEPEETYDDKNTDDGENDNYKDDEDVDVDIDLGEDDEVVDVTPGNGSANTVQPTDKTPVTGNKIALGAIPTALGAIALFIKKRIS